ncbi:MAG: TetR/AcrR family transcriptional regulator [Clostridia bacterium]|nr:TetR/AcrR family transcriptional regulator [Clostridia bacterium]
MNDTRRAILDSALRHFADADYASVNLEDIARDANVTRAPLYYYFKNKEGLYRTLVRTTLEDARTHMDALLSADEDIFEVIRKEYGYCIHGLGDYRRIWYPGAGAPDCRDEVQAFSQWLIDRKTEIFTAARERDELSRDCDVAELVTLLYVFFYGTLDTLEFGQRLKGFNVSRLEHSEEWFMDIVRERYGVHS